MSCREGKVRASHAAATGQRLATKTSQTSQGLANGRRIQGRARQKTEASHGFHRACHPVRGGDHGKKDQNDECEGIAGFAIAPGEEERCGDKEPSGPGKHGLGCGALQFAEQRGPAREKFLHDRIRPRATESLQSPRGEGEACGEKQTALPDSRVGRFSESNGPAKLLRGEQDEWFEPGNPKSKAPKAGGGPSPSRTCSAHKSEIGGERGDGQGNKQ